MFTYKDLLNEMDLFCKHGVSCGNIGSSELGNTIPYVFVGNENGNSMIVHGGIHAREHLTSLLVVNLAKYLVANSHLRLDGGIYFVPMVNPDGVMLCQNGAGFIYDKEKRKQLVEINNGSKDFSLWKANINGIDLNVNFDVKWGEGKENVFYRSSANYVGISPLCAKESKRLAEFTEKVKPLVTLSYHLNGEEIYWEFGQSGPRRFRDKKYAQALSKITGYKLVGDSGSTGGYKDWCIETLKIPSYTVEVGNDKFSHPFPYSEFYNIYEQNKDIPRRLLNSVVADRNKLLKGGLLGVMK